jgi:hypothetical protein
MERKKRDDGIEGVKTKCVTVAVNFIFSNCVM